MTAIDVKIAAVSWPSPALMLTPNEERDMADIASIASAVAINAELRVGVEDAYLVVDGGHRIGPIPTGQVWAGQARTQQQAMLIIGLNPRRSNQYRYIRRYGRETHTAILRVVPNT
jgi:hypothetical protein